MPQARLTYIDNMRWTIILLVISMHAADTYSPLGNWYFTDRQPLSPPELIALAAWQTYLQSFFMGLLFLIAGYFVPGAYDRKGPARFLKDRAVRLGIPVLLYMFVIGPVTEYYVAHSWTSTGPDSFPAEWIEHIRNGQFLQENGPLWFCLALLIFCIVYAAAPTMRIPRRPPGTKSVIAFAALIAASTFLLRTFHLSSFLNLHLGDFPQYIFLFTAGIAAARGAWLERLSYSRGIKWLAFAVPLGFLYWFALLYFGGALKGNGADYSGGWHWQSAAFCLWEAFTGVAISFGLLVLYREKFNHQGTLSQFLSANAFAVYVFHPPIVILFARLLTALTWPPLTRFALLTVLSTAGSFIASALVFRRIPFLRRIL